MLGTPGFEQRDPMCNKQWLHVTYKKIHHWKSSYKLSGNEVALVLYRLAAEFCRNRFELEKTEAAVLKGLICETWEQEDSWDEFANTTGRTWALGAAPFACWFVLTRPLPAASLIGWVFWNISIPAEVMIGPVWRKYYMLKTDASSQGLLTCALRYNDFSRNFILMAIWSALGNPRNPSFSRISMTGTNSQV